MRETIDFLTGLPKYRADDTFRVEPLPRSNEVASGLAARIHDPAWALTRQWQLGEFGGQDAGSPVLVQISGKSTLISAWRPAGDDADPAWIPYLPSSGPLDASIESENPSEPDERARVEGGAHFVRLLDEAGLTAALPQVLSSYGFDPAPGGPADFVTALSATTPDARRLAGAIDNGGIAIAGLNEVAIRWRAWWRGIQPADVRDTFDPHRFESRADFSFGGSVLHADDYLGDGLDWFTVDVVDGVPAAPAVDHVINREAIASPIRYGGIPADRFWEMEDAQIDLASTDVSTLDTGRLLLIGFAEVYGNDWFSVPVEVPAGSITSVDQLIVTDTFGQRFLIPRAGRDNPEWNLFTVTGSDDGLLVMPSERGSVGQPLESIALVRDELANLAWAIEGTVTDGRGLPVDRRERWLRIEPEPPAVTDQSYAVQTIVPDYWLPLVPQAVGLGAIRLTLVPLQQPGADSAPLGSLLNAGTWIHEEEIPREGALVIRRPVLGRWFDGSWHAWIRREKNPGSGESSSGLAFDIVRPSEPWP